MANLPPFQAAILQHPTSKSNNSLLMEALLTRDFPRPFLAASVLLAAIFIAVPAAAQSIARPDTWTLTPFLTSSMGAEHPAPKDSFGLGLGVGYDWTSNLGFEGEFSHLFDIAGNSADVDWSVTNFSANGIYHFDAKHVTPYATLGLGFEVSDKGDDDDVSSTEMAINFGGGVKYAINNRWTVRGDLRRFEAFDLAPDYWRIYGGMTFRLGQ